MVEHTVPYICLARDSLLVVQRFLLTLVGGGLRRMLACVLAALLACVFVCLTTFSSFLSTSSDIL